MINKRTKIVCTIGPASDSVDVLVKMIEQGMNVARLNFSHGTHESHSASIANIRQASERTGQIVGLMLDIQGQKIRTHKMEKDAVELKVGSVVRISMKQVLGTSECFSVTYPGLIHDVNVGYHLLIDDGLLILEITDIDYEKEEIYAVVQTGGILKNAKGMNVPEAKFTFPGLTEKDKEDIRFGAEAGVDFIAASFVRRPEDILEIHQVLEEEDARHIQIIAKIENQEGVQNAREILQVCDGIMVARGDLGVEINGGDVPIVQKHLIRLCNEAGKTAITATQMLDSMQWNPRPTRAEASDVANAVWDGTDAVMLSGESAVGKYPVEAVGMLAVISARAEEAWKLGTQQWVPEQGSEVNAVTEAISRAVVQTANSLNVKTIIAATKSGYTARMIAKYRPHSNIVVATYSEEVMRGLSLTWGVLPFTIPHPHDVDDMIAKVMTLVKENQLVTAGENVIITAGTPVHESGTTNLMKVEQVKENL